MAIEAGQDFPSFAAQDQDGQTVDLNDYRGSDKLVVFFYPRAGTSG